jgi:hypothetical protein
MDLDEGLSSKVEEFARELDNKQGAGGVPASPSADADGDGDSDGDFDDEFDDCDEGADHGKTGGVAK